LENDWTLDPAIQSELSDKWYDQPDVVAGIKLNMQTLPFDPEGSGYDMESAKSVGMKPEIDPEDGLPHYGSVIETTKEQQKQYGLPEESYMLLKGKSHETWDKAIQGEADRGFRVKKFGDRYFSIPGEINTEGKDVEAGASDDVYKNYILSWEGDFFPEAKKATEDEKELTIGYGHYGEDVKPGQTITREEADVLLDKDIQKRMPAIMKAIPKFNNLSENLRKNIVSSWYRGSLSGSPKTIELINQGKFKEAAKEFLDNDEYRNAEKRNRSGIKSRMKATSKALADE
jgi:GH24 family phage-related lysozyme (muramidase)